MLFAYSHSDELFVPCSPAAYSLFSPYSASSFNLLCAPCNILSFSAFYPAQSFNLLDLLSLQPFSVLFYFSCSIYFLILAGLAPLAFFLCKLFYVMFLSSASLFLTFALSFFMFFIFGIAFCVIILNVV